MTIVKASEDYTPYSPKSTEELDHVVEIYNFPSSLTTGDIIHAFSMFDSDSMYVVWVDETHALLVLGSSSQGNHLIKFIFLIKSITFRKITLITFVAKLINRQ